MSGYRWQRFLLFTEAEGQAEVEWFKGCKSGPWKPCTVRPQGEKGPRFVPFTELVPLSCIWLWGFELTAACALGKKTTNCKRTEEQVPAEKQVPAEVAEGDLCLTDYDKYIEDRGTSP